MDKAKLWNQRLGHINFTNLANILKEEAVAELPLLLKVKAKIYGSTQKFWKGSKQKKISKNK